MLEQPPTSGHAIATGSKSGSDVAVSDGGIGTPPMHSFGFSLTA
jgi:hypothetical protein